MFIICDVYFTAASPKNNLPQRHKGTKVKKRYSFFLRVLVAILSAIPPASPREKARGEVFLMIL